MASTKSPRRSTLRNPDRWRAVREPATLRPVSTDELASPRESTERLPDVRGVATLGDDDEDDSWHSLQRGESVGRYVVIARVGAGAMGEERRVGKECRSRWSAYD